MPTPAALRIDRANRVRCIACHAWVAPDERLQAAFRGGHNVRFYVCLDCIEDYSRPRCCDLCGDPLTLDNLRIWREKGKIKSGNYCMECFNETAILNYRQRQKNKLNQRLRDIVRSE